jgi:hypothetical protein
MEYEKQRGVEKMLIKKRGEKIKEIKKQKT